MQASIISESFKPKWKAAGNCDPADLWAGSEITHLIKYTSSMQHSHQKEVQPESNDEKLDKSRMWDILQGQRLHITAPQKPRVYKKSCIYYSYMFKRQLPSKYSPFNAIHLPRHFFPLFKTILNALILLPLNASAVFFVLPLPH